TPLRDLGPEPLELLPRLPAIAAQPSKISRRRHGAPWLPVRVRRSADRESSSLATANGLVAPLSRSARRSSTQRFVASSVQSRRRTSLSTTSTTRARNRARRRVRSTPL